MYFVNNFYTLKAIQKIWYLWELWDLQLEFQLSYLGLEMFGCTAGVCND